MAVLLFASLSALFVFLLVPGEYSSSPAAYTLDQLRRSVESRFTAEKEAKLAIVGRTVSSLIRSSLLLGLCTGALGFLAAYFFAPHWLALLICVFCFAGGVALSQVVAGSEFKGWQARVFEEVPTLTSFAPAFLKVGGITLRDAISMTVPFLKGPLRDEIWVAMDKIKRTGNTKDAFDDLAERVDHPCMDSICLRLSTAWVASPSPDLFIDLSDQMQDMEELAATGTTAGKTGMLALICLLSLAGAMLVFGYPAWVYMASKLTMGFGG
jgi:hypothetical protein